MSGHESLSADRRGLLTGLVGRRAPSLKGVLIRVGHQALADDEREALRDVVIAEFCEFGLGADDEPNEYGLLLEDLIDQLGHV